MTHEGDAISKHLKTVGEVITPDTNLGQEHSFRAYWRPSHVSDEGIVRCYHTILYYIIYYLLTQITLITHW